MRSHTLFVSLIFCILYHISFTIAAGDCPREQSPLEKTTRKPLSLTKEDDDAAWEARYSIFQKCEENQRWPTEVHWSDAEVLCSNEHRSLANWPETYQEWRDCVLRKELHLRNVQKMILERLESCQRANVYRDKEVERLRLEEVRQKDVNIVRLNLQGFDDAQHPNDGPSGITLGGPKYSKGIKSLDDKGNRGIREFEQRLAFKKGREWPIKCDPDIPDVNDKYKIKDFDENGPMFGPPLVDLRGYNSIDMEEPGSSVSSESIDQKVSHEELKNDQVVNNNQVDNNLVEDPNSPELIYEIRRRKTGTKGKFYKFIGFNLDERKRDQVWKLIFGSKKKDKKKKQN